MNRIVLKDLLREIRRSWMRIVSVLGIVMVSVAFFAGMKATAPDMKYTADQYFDQYNMMDVQVMSTLGLTKDDIAYIADTTGVEKVQAGYFADVVSTLNSTETVFKVHSLPLSKDGGHINDFKITEGRYPEKSGECLIEDASYLALGLKIGDTIHVSSGKDKLITDDTLKTDTFTIVGKVITPYYLTYDKGTTEIGNGKISSFMMIREDDFIYPFYTEALITVKGAKDLNTFSPEYDKCVEGVTTMLENLGVDRSNIRLQEVKAEATKQLDDGKAKYEEAKKKYNDEIAKGESDLNDAQMKLVEGEATLVQQQDSFAQQKKSALIQIADAKQQLADGEKQYTGAQAQYDSTMSQYGGDLATMNQNVNTLQQLRAQAQTSKADLENQLQNPDLTDQERTNIQGLINQYDGLMSLADNEIGRVVGLNALAQNTVGSSKAQLDSARNELDAARQKVNQSEQKLASAESEANKQFAQGKKDLANGWMQYNEGQNTLQEKKVSGQAQLDAANEEIIQKENEIEKISNSKWYVLNRHSNIGFADFEATAKSVDSIATLFPAFFFLVAALVCLTTMTRMVTEQRGNIGTYKALGYNERTIAIKYVTYAAAASIIGAVVGCSIGMYLFPDVIYNSWLLKYTMPPLKYITQIPLETISILMGVLVTTLATYLACNKELKETPSLLMRPKAPKAGKIILMERIAFLWRHLSFSQKVTARNIFRYKGRFFMTIIGIAGCTALLLAGFGLNNSISQVVNKQFKEIFTYNLSVRYVATANDTDKEAVKQILTNEANINSFMPDTELNATAKSTGEGIAATLICASDTQKFKDFITLRKSSNQEPIPLTDNGVVITEKLSKQLGVGIGDAFELDNGIGAVKKVRVAAITENYLLHYIYITNAYYKEIFHLDPVINSTMIKLSNDSTEAENNIASKLIKNDKIASVSFYSVIADNFDHTVQSLNNIVIVIIACAGLLAFIVLYNLTNININERLREIATIKVLGFYNREVYSYVFRENLLLTLIGAAAGLGLGIVLHRFIMVSIEQDGIMFGNYIKDISFLYSIGITFAFAELVSLFMNGRLKRIHMVESLKSVE